MPKMENRASHIARGEMDMLPFNKILAPLNPSRTLPGMARFILSIVQRYNAQLHLLFVTQYLRHYLALFASRAAIVKLERALLQRAEKQLCAFKNEHFQIWPGIITKVVLGDISEEIIRYAETKAMELVILGSHTTRGLGERVGGSVSRNVITSVTAPVLVIKPRGKKGLFSFNDLPGAHQGSSTAVKPIAV